MKKAKKGFTLVELIVVIAIIAILAAVSVAGYYGFIESAKKSAAEQEAAQAKIALQAAFTPYGEVKESDSVVRTYTFTINGIESSDTVVTTIKQNAVKDFKAVLESEKAGFAAGSFDLDTVVLANEESTDTTVVHYITSITYFKMDGAKRGYSSEISFLAK